MCSSLSLCFFRPKPGEKVMHDWEQFSSSLSSFKLRVKLVKLFLHTYDEKKSFNTCSFHLFFILFCMHTHSHTESKQARSGYLFSRPCIIAVRKAHSMKWMAWVSEWSSSLLDWRFSSAGNLHDMGKKCCPLFISYLDGTHILDTALE